MTGSLLVIACQRLLKDKMYATLIEILELAMFSGEELAALSEELGVTLTRNECGRIEVQHDEETHCG